MLLIQEGLVDVEAFRGSFHHYLGYSVPAVSLTLGRLQQGFGRFLVNKFPRSAVTSRGRVPTIMFRQSPIKIVGQTDLKFAREFTSQNAEQIHHELNARPVGSRTPTSAVSTFHRWQTEQVNSYQTRCLESLNPFHWKELRVEDAGVRWAQ